MLARNSRMELARPQAGVANKESRQLKVALGLLLVALAVEGLGSCWISSTLFCREIATQSLGLPAAWEPMGAIGVGHPAAPAPDRLDRDPEEFVVHL